MKRIIAPSILSANFLSLGDDIEMLNKSNAEWIHCDIMDGHFVPNLSFGFPIIKNIRKKTNKVLDVHLMISNAEQYVDSYIDAGANVLTVHYEAVCHLNRTIQSIKDRNVMAGVSLNPHTPISVLEEIIQYVDLILIMSVNPGFGGQKFIETSIAKIKKLNDLRNKLNPNCLIQVDGGVSVSNAKTLYDSGANVLVAGNAVFNSENPTEEINKILNI